MSIAEAPVTPPKPVPTPCIDVCTMDEATGLCLGCARTAEEIAAWQSAEPGFKRAVWDALPARRARLKMTVHRLPWLAEECSGFIEDALTSRSGRWRLGIHGAEVDFAVGADEPAEILSDAEAVSAVTPRFALRLLKHEKTIPISFGGYGTNSAVSFPCRLGRPKAGPGPTRISAGAAAGCEAIGPRLEGQGDARREFADEQQAIGFVLPRGRVKLRKAPGLNPLGPDRDAIIERHRHSALYDTGIGAGLAARICLRTADPELAARLYSLRHPESPEGCPGSRAESPHATPDNACGISGVTPKDRLNALISEARQQAFDIVVETGLGRAEVFAPVDTFCLNLERLTEPRELPPGWELKPVFALGALFYPGQR